MCRSGHGRGLPMPPTNWATEWRRPRGRDRSAYAFGGGAWGSAFERRSTPLEERRRGGETRIDADLVPSLSEAPPSWAAPAGRQSQVSLRSPERA
jgi:hypothetical protein